MNSKNISKYKAVAAKKALEFVKSGMILGLGTGSTTKFFVEYLGDAIKNGELEDIKAIATSKATEELAKRLGIHVVDINDFQTIDLVVDGADEIDKDLNLIKGLGKALLREKLVESHSRKFIVIADESKVVNYLGEHKPLPVEVVPFGWATQQKWLESLGCKAELWFEDGKPVVTDNHNYIIRCWFENGIKNAPELAALIKNRTGVVEHGLFIDMADIVIIAGEKGINIKHKARREYEKN